jgi:hypothetical protein
VVGLSPRPGLHRGDFVDRNTGVEYRSRWQKSAATFGPLGRVAWSALVVGGLMWAFFAVFFVAWFCLLGVGIVVLRDIWQPGRVLPARPRPAFVANPDRASQDSSERESQVPLPRAVIVFRSLLAVSGLAAILAFDQGSLETKAAVVMVGTLIGMYAFLRGFLR